MAKQYFYIKQNDTKPYLTVYLSHDGVAQDLTGASVVFHMNTTTPVSAAAVIDSAADGKVSYQWAATDTTEVGVFSGEFQVTYSDSTVETFPNRPADELVITITAELA